MDPTNAENQGYTGELRIPEGATARDWAEVSRAWVAETGFQPPSGCRVVHDCILPGEASTTPAGVAPVVVLTGMHRSGTSLFGRYLMASGVDLGDALIGPLPSNPYGHFEDLAFVELHEQALARSWKHPRFSAEERAAARQLVEARKGRGLPWGWKDPRTCFFLSEWAELIPEAVFVLLFREPLQVVDSMCRRRERDTNSPEANSGALGSWIGHNRELLRFHRKQPERSLLVSVERAVRNPAGLAQALRERTGFPFAEERFRACYDTEILHTRKVTHRPVSWRLRIQAALLHRQLKRASIV
jgi:hypothetical protein